MKSGYIDPYTERFAVTLFISTVLHLIIIYGVGFVMPKPGKPFNTTMEIILVQKSTKEVPEKADYLAQTTHEGGGDSKSKTHPTTPTLAPFPEQTAELVFTPPPSQMAAEANDPQTEILTTAKLTQYQIEPQTEITPIDDPAEQGYSPQNVIFDEYVSENTLFINTSVAKLASIQAELADTFNSYAKRLRHKYISASTKEFKYAHYMEAWRRRVENIGNINYPNQARRRKLSGSLILDVALNPNGTIRQVEIKESSKHRILDEAALRIVRLAAPFAPFPEHIRKETDILHITRRWEFRYNSLTTRQ